jgi:hypothetical protein
LAGSRQLLRARSAAVLIVRLARVPGLLFWLALATAPATVPAEVADAQSAKVDITLPPHDSLALRPPAVRTIGVVSARHTSELIRNGFPARLHYKIERWAAGSFVNDVKARTEWELIVEYDALSKKYRVIRVTPDRATLLGEYDSIADANAKVEEPYQPRLSTPRKGNKSYYAVTLTVEAMSLTDLDEVQRWLKGELRPAMRGRRNPGTAVSSGLRTLLVRILGGERLQYQAATGTFTP